MGDWIHLSRAHLTGVEEEYVLEALRSGWVAPVGPMVDRFEKAMAARLGVADAVALSSGTAALHVALSELGARPGRVVVLPTMTFVASANAVAYTGAEPVFVDSLRSDGTVDPELLLDTVRSLLDAGTDVAAVMSVDLFGRACDYAAIEPALAELGIPLVEDAAEGLGSTRDGRAVGAFGRCGVLSFNGNKILTTSGGGMLVSDDTALTERARHLSTQAREATPWYEHTETGFNYRLSNVLAALGLAQLSRFDGMLARRQEIRQQYATALADVPGVDVLGSCVPAGATDNCWLTCITLDPLRVGVTPTQVIEKLRAADVEARHVWKPMHRQPLFRTARARVTGASDHLFRTSLALPSGSELDDDDLHRVRGALADALGAPR